MRKWHLCVLVTATLIVAAGPPERTTPQRWGVIIGISDYINFGDEIGGDLPGAANDARAMADVLVHRYGFAPDNVRLVLDHDATRDRIQREMTDWLPSVSRDGDHIFFFFAGHGSQAWDLDGDEPDGLDETLCPADVTRGNTDADITDDEINGWLRGLPTDNVVVLWDKCHARSSTRAVTPFARPRSLDRVVQRDVPRPDEMESAGAGVEDAGDWVGLEIAAAQADEVAIDAVFGGEDGAPVTYGGAFTTYFVRNLWSARRGATYEEVFEKTRRDLQRERFAQKPSIEEKALKDGAIFALADGSPAGGEDVTFPVLESSADRVVLGGGAAARMTVGSVYRAGDASLRVESVEADRAVTSLMGGSLPGKGASARLEAYSHPRPELRVSVGELDAGSRAALEEALAEGTGLRLLADTRSLAHLIVRPRNGHLVVLGLDGFARDSVAAGAGGALAGLLQRELRALHLAELENPVQPFRLDFAFGNGRNDFRLGEAVEFEFESERAGYLTIVDVGPSGEIAVLFPNEFDGDNRIRTGQRLSFPTARMLEEARFEAIEPTGRGIVRVFLTERPLEIEASDAPLASRIWGALRRSAGSEGPAAIPVDNWGTAAIAYEIRH